MKDKSMQRMAQMPVPKLMIRMGLPIVISMMLQALYNIVDSAFVSNMQGGEQALNALTLAFPVQMLMVAVGIGTGVGVNVMLARSLGEQDSEQASAVAANGIFLGAVITAVFMVFGAVGVPGYIRTQTADPVISEMAVTYLRICCLCAVGIVFFSLFEKILQASGLTVHSTVAQITGAVINIVLDPVLIYGLLGLPRMGVAGAALATVIGQVASFVLALVFHLRRNQSVKNGVRYLRPRGHIIRRIYAIGLPAIIAQALMSVMTYGINIILGSVSAALVTAYGLYYKIQQFILFAAFGLRDTITPIVSFAYGMRDKKRIASGIRCGVLYTAVLMAAGALALEILADVLCAAFGLSGETQALCVSATRIISAGFVFAGFSLSLQGVFQALDRGFSSLVISLLRQLVLILPVTFVLTRFIAPDLSNAFIVWFTFPAAELITAAVAALLMVCTYRVRLTD